MSSKPDQGTPSLKSESIVRQHSSLILVLLLAACGSEPEPVPPPAPVVASLPPAPRPRPPEPEPSELCPALAALMAGHQDGFATARREPLTEDVWRADPVLPGTDRCTIEGDRWPRARLLCASEGYAPGGSEIRRTFEAIEDEVDQCLGKPFWFPRAWEKGRRFEFALGEQQVSWLDQSTAPPTAVVLQVHQDIVSRAYELRFNLETVR